MVGTATRYANGKVCGSNGSLAMSSYTSSSFAGSGESRT